MNNPMDRRQLGKALLLGAAGAAVSHSQPSAPARLVPWMYMIWPLEQWLTGYGRILDAWDQGGVRGIVIGPIGRDDSCVCARSGNLPEVRRGSAGECAIGRGEGASATGAAR